MFGRISHTWNMMKLSWGVLKQDKELLTFPLVSGIVSLLVTASFVVPMIWGPRLFDKFSQQGQTGDILFYAYVFAFYVVSYFVIIFFNAALVACANLRLDGGDPTVGYGLREASRRLGSIVGWALVAGSVGLILKIIEDRFEGLGRFISGLFGAIWTLITFFVVPFLVIENKSPIDAIKESGSLFKETWGEQLTANFSFGLLFFLLSIPGVLVIGISTTLGSPLMMVGFAVGGLYVLVLSLISSALSAIFQTALFRYAKYGSVSGEFTEEMLEGTVKVFG